MNKLYKYKKILFYFVFVIMVVFMWSFGSFNVSHSSASYKSDISGDSTAKVAKWNIGNLSKKKGKTMDLEVGFSEKITDTDSGRHGDWFLELDNQSEVKAQIDLDSKISLQLHHDTFTGLKNNDWNFLGSINPLKFNLSLYNGSMNEVVTYKYGSDELSYNDYCNSTPQAQAMYTKVVDTSKLICTIINTSSVPAFTSSKMVGGKIVYSIDVKLRDILNTQELIDKLEFGLGTGTKVLHLTWEIDDSSIITVDDFSDLNSQPKNENYTYVVVNEGNKKYKWDWDEYLVSGKFVPISVSAEKYKRYELSTTKGTIVSGTDPDGYSVTIGGDTELYYLNEIECDFADYFLFSHGEPTYTFGNTMIRFSLLTSSQIAQVQDRTITNNGVSSSPTSADYNDLKLYLEKLEYPQYDRFQQEYVSFASGSIYLSYGLSCKFILELKVVQVD